MTTHVSTGQEQEASCLLFRLPEYIPAYRDTATRWKSWWISVSFLVLTAALALSTIARADTHTASPSIISATAKTVRTQRHHPVFQKGIASWYDEHGGMNRHTAQGERFDSSRLTAAHPFLPFGTRLLVRSQRTGRSVVVRINDRGPYTRHRIIDLSRSAAERLGIIHSGITPVTLSILTADNADNEVAQIPSKSRSAP